MFSALVTPSSMTAARAMTKPATTIALTFGPLRLSTNQAIKSAITAATRADHGRAPVRREDEECQDQESRPSSAQLTQVIDAPLDVGRRPVHRGVER